MSLWSQGQQGAMYELHQSVPRQSLSKMEFTQMPPLPPSDSYTTPGIALNYYILVYFVWSLVHPFAVLGLHIHPALGFALLFAELGLLVVLATAPVWAPLVALAVALKYAGVI